MLKAGIIGLGVGEAHIEGYRNHPDCEVVALCDFSPEKLAYANNKYPALHITDNADEIIKDPSIDVVSIASYDNFHHDQVMAALACNKHVFVEKPLCLNEGEARNICRMLKRKPALKISSNLILRKYPRFINLKEKIARGELGEIYHIEGDYNYGRLEKITKGWRGQIDYYSVTLGGGIHMIDLLFWLTGDRITEVAACGNNISSRGSQFKYPDMVSCILKFQSGMTGKMAVNFGCVHPHFHNLSVYGTKATFINSINSSSYWSSRNPQIAPIMDNSDYPGAHKGALLYNFIDAIINDSTPEVTQQAIFYDLAVCFAVENSLQANSFVKVELI
ncbi:MAG: Gfo/Idh/MocA family protein [Smithellaceae bacterium]